MLANRSSSCSIQRMNQQPARSRLMNDVSCQIQSWQEHFDRNLASRLKLTSHAPGLLSEAMQYSALSGGKRMRPLLTYASARSLDISPERVDGIACAIELIHAYSLIHDDPPAMDVDDIRRGNPTCHKAFDEATAILAGDALQAFAFEILSSDPEPVSYTHLTLPTNREV